jgi:hypothetical protein
MPRITAASPFSTFAYVPPTPAPPPFIPAGALVFYNQTFTGITGWQRYSLADGLFLRGTATQLQVGTTSSPTLTGNVTSTISTSGAHNPTQISFGPAFNPGGTAFPGGWFNLGTSGSHFHTIPSLDLSTIGIPTPANYSTYILIQSTVETKRLPPNSIVFSQNQPGSLFSILSAENKPIRGGVSNNNSGTGTTITNIRVTSQNGTHSHIDTNFPYDPATVISTNYPYVTTLNHNHNLTLEIAVQSIFTKLLTAWSNTFESYLGLDTIIMYTGSLSSLPTGWYVCDGSNGTINMVDYFVGFGSQLAWDTSTGSPNDVIAQGTTNTNVWSHNHRGTGIPGNTPATLASVPHGTNTASHVHTVTPTVVNPNYDPGSVRVAFIQYKGY